MKIWEIDFVDGKSYKDDKGFIWEVEWRDLITKICDEYQDIAEVYDMVDILSIDFEELKG